MRQSEREQRFETLAVHAGCEVDPATGAVAPPIYPSTTFERAPDGTYPHGYVYSRTSNPNRQALEASLAALEGAETAVAFASGSATALSLFQALRPGDHVLAPDDVYHGVRRLLRETFEPWGLAVTFADLSDLSAVRAALRPETRLVWVETPSNPLLKITDIAAVAALAHTAGARCVVDNTWATPALQRPLALGADAAMHSTTKYLGGHGDVTGGALAFATQDDFAERVRALQQSGGAVPSPFDCWLVLRGIRTLPYRMRAHAANAARVAAFLTEHPAVAVVHYPGLPAHRGHDVAARQMALPGAMISVQVRGGRAAAMAVAAKVEVFTRATSLGAIESLIEHRASVEGPDSPTPDNLLRLSIGLEHPDDLIADLANALG